MHKNFNEIASDKRWTELTGVMKDVRRELSALAPHPQRADKNTRDDRDGMLGGMLLDGLLGGAFLSAITDAFNLPAGVEELPVGTAVELYDEYSRDRHNVSDSFNAGATHRRAPRSAEAAFWDRYLTDLPSRRTLEQNIAGISRRLDRIEQHYATQSFKPARPSLAM